MTKMGSIVGDRIDYNGVGVLRGQQHTYPAKLDLSRGGEWYSGKQEVSANSTQVSESRTTY